MKEKIVKVRKRIGEEGRNKFRELSWPGRKDEMY
jgi:hypothetical protein